MYGSGKDYLILITFRVLQISYFTLKLKCFYSDSDNCPNVDQNNVSVPPLVKGRSSPTNILVFLPSSFVLLRFFVVLYILFCMYFCVSLYISDISAERNVLHIHPPL